VAGAAVAIGLSGLPVAMVLGRGTVAAAAPARHAGLEVSTASSTTGLFDGAAFAVSGATSGRAVVRSDVTGELTVRAVDVRSDDNGCIEPETAAGDRTCGDGDGELDRAVEVVVSDGGGVVWSGSVATLADGFSAGAIRAGHPRPFVWALSLPSGAPNEAQGDSLAFGVRFSLDERPPAGGGPASVTLPALGRLARTGMRWEPIALALALVVGGAGLLLVAGRRRTLHRPLPPEG
jgi:hypothetical protein